VNRALCRAIRPPTRRWTVWDARPVTQDAAAAWRSSLPSKRMGAGVLIRDEQGRVLLVEPTYKPYWEIPGGAVEADESPRAACMREVEEELGLRLEVGRLLCIEWQGPEPDRSESLMLVYDGGALADTSGIVLPPDELASYRFVEADELATLTVPRLVRRIEASLEALANGSVAELEDGVDVGPR
jgi:8-oxo-dGTP pyrophosphatase MutT (NUDIX family)